MNAWRSGDTAAARDQLTAIITDGSEDPRVYYYRGILAEQLHCYTGEPLSVAPLTWSHATFVETVLLYVEAEAALSRP